jgi:putative Mg2+ transporter-C (MgtC) family protein
MPRLRIQLHGDLSRKRFDRGECDVPRMRPLPFNPVVDAPLLGFTAQSMEPAPRAELALLIRLVVAGVLAAALGWEREAAHKPAGLRTHILVGVASALFTVLGELALRQSPGNDAIRSDPVRIIQAISIGIGFLGSGVIFVSKSSDTVRGLTTAASIWATAAIGVAVGLQLYILATGTTLLLLLVLRGMGRFERDGGD